MSKKIKIDIDQLFQKEAYETITQTHSEILNSDDPTHILYLGISYLKTNAIDKADTIFEYLSQHHDTTEIQTYRILTKIKNNENEKAEILYRNLCQKENQIILDYLENNQMNDVKHKCLFLLSIPINIKTQHDAESLIESIKNYDYHNAVNILNETDA